MAGKMDQAAGGFNLDGTLVSADAADKEPVKKDKVFIPNKLTQDISENNNILSKLQKERLLTQKAIMELNYQRVAILHDDAFENTAQIYTLDQLDNQTKISRLAVLAKDFEEIHSTGPTFFDELDKYLKDNS